MRGYNIWLRTSRTCLAPVCFPSKELWSVVNMEWNFLSVVGAVYLGYCSLKLLLQISHGIRAFVLPALGIKKNLKKLGEWAGNRNPIVLTRRLVDPGHA